MTAKQTNYPYRYVGKKKKKKPGSFGRIALIWTLILVVLGTVCLFYVHGLLVRYEDSQPEKAAERALSTVREAEAAGTLSSLLPDFVPDDAIAPLRAALADGRALSCVKKAGVHDLERTVYTVTDGDDDLAELTLVSRGTETKLAVFTFTDWQLERVTPPTVRYRLTLPASFSLSHNGEPVAPEAKGADTASYLIDYDGSTFLFSDSTGAKAAYVPGEVPTASLLTVTVPENFTVSSGEHTFGDEDVTERRDAEGAEFLAEYGVSLPDLVTYSLDLLPEGDPIVITDNRGEPAVYPRDAGSVTVTAQSGGERDEDLPGEDEILFAAEQWSRFMTQDLAGAKNGFYTLEPLLLPDSYLYGVALDWATGVDITFTSVHSLDNPPFSDEAVSRFIRYTDDCFSCEVTLQKNMIVIRQPLPDVMHATMYWVRDPADGVWKIADIIDIDDAA